MATRAGRIFSEKKSVYIHAQVSFDINSPNITYNVNRDLNEIQLYRGPRKHQRCVL